MLLTGTFKRSVDEKQRIAIPKKIRDKFVTSAKPDLIYIAPGTDGSLAMYTEEAFSTLAERIAAASPAEQDVRAFSRLLYARAEAVDVDKQGRVRIPTELARLAELKSEAVLVGVRDHLELWDSTRWQAYLSAKQSDYDELAERAFATAPARERGSTLSNSD